MGGVPSGPSSVAASDSSEQPASEEPALAEPASSDPACVLPIYTRSDADAGSPALASEPGTKSEIVSLKTPGVTKPRLLCAPQIRMSKEAYANGVGGIALIRCILEVDGWLSHCRVIKGLPYMEDQILAGMATVRFEPATYQGHPVRVQMVVPIRIAPPPPRVLAK
jgi:hypothetical protein